MLEQGNLSSSEVEELIEGSVVSYFATSGDQQIQLPKKDLTIVGFVVYSQVLGIVVTPGSKAYFAGSPAGTYIFQAVQFKSPEGTINCTTSGNEVVVITYYGQPGKDTKPLSDFTSILVTGSLTIPASLSTTTLETTSISATFPGGASKITGFEYSFPGTPSGVSLFGVYLSFPSLTGQSINMAIPYGSTNSFVPDYPSGTGILPLALPIATTFTMTLGAYAQNSNTSSTVVGTYQLILYYK